MEVTGKRMSIGSPDAVLRANDEGHQNIDEGEEVFEIEKVLKKRKDQSGQYWFKIKWRGDFEPSYEREDDIDPEAIEEFEEERIARKERGEVEPRTESDEEWDSGEGESDVDDEISLENEDIYPNMVSWQEKTSNKNDKRHKKQGTTGPFEASESEEQINSIMTAVFRSLSSSTQATPSHTSSFTRTPSPISDSSSCTASTTGSGCSDEVSGRVLDLSPSKSSPSTNAHTPNPTQKGSLSRNRNIRSTPVVTSAPCSSSPINLSLKTAQKTGSTSVNPKRGRSSSQPPPPESSQQSEALPTAPPSQTPMTSSSSKRGRKRKQSAETEEDVNEDQNLTQIKTELPEENEDLKDVKFDVSPSQALLGMLENIKSCPTYITKVVEENKELNHLLQKQTKSQSDAEVKIKALQKENEDLKKKTENIDEERRKHAELQAAHTDLQERHTKMLRWYARQISEFRDDIFEEVVPQPSNFDDFIKKL